MEIYRKYFNEEQLHELEASGANFGINVATVGHHIHPPGRRYPDPNHPATHLFQGDQGRRLQEYQIVYVATGKGIYQGENADPVMLESGSLMLLFPGVWHRYQPMQETGWEEFWVGFNGQYAEYLMRQDCFDPQNPIIRIGFNAEFLNVCIRLLDTVKYEGVAFQQMASCLVIQLLGIVYASSLMMGKAKPRQEQIVHTIRYKIHENWGQALDFEVLAQQQNVSYVWFRKAFKDVMGVSPGQYHLNVKIENTARMLKTLPLTIAQIAFKAGFESEFYFSRIFKKKMGTTPTEYRKGAKQDAP